MAEPRLVGFYKTLKQPRNFRTEDVATLFKAVDPARVTQLATALAHYISANVPQAIARKNTFADYRTNPYVLMASAGAIDLSNPKDLASFLVHNKLYMGLETSFGKSIESICLGAYPIGARSGSKWMEPPEKAEEAKALGGLGHEDKARRRDISVWREIDKSCVVGRTRYLMSIKSGPQTINDTQVEAMKSAIRDHYQAWMATTKKSRAVTNLDVVIGLTYGTNKTTNNKENQILVKLLEHGFDIDNQSKKPGVLIDTATRSVRVYRCVGIDFWALVGCPDDPASTEHTFLEVLLALSKSLSEPPVKKNLEDAVNTKIDQLVGALRGMKFPKASLPNWMRGDFSETQLTWLASAMSAFYDGGI